MTLTEFLLDRISEDAARAQAVADDKRHPERPVSLMDGWDSEFAFLQRYTPARVLAECEAKRRVLRDLGDYCYTNHATGSPCGTCDRVGCRNLRALAGVYADHLDYREEWNA